MSFDDFAHAIEKSFQTNRQFGIGFGAEYSGGQIARRSFDSNHAKSGTMQAGIDAYARQGYENEWRLHHQGGPMGYAARDFKATPTETRLVAEHQLVGWNPSITGTKSEDTMLSGGEILTSMEDWPQCGTRPDILVRS